jgi:ABC-type glycerol-3-phosphate transport system substrate-binding protein
MSRAGNIIKTAIYVAVGVGIVGCSGVKKSNQEFTILVRMMPAQQRFFEQEIVEKFNKERNCKITVASFTDQWDIERFLKLDAGKKKPEIGLVKVPFEVTRVLAYKGYMQPLTKAVDSGQAMMDLAEYHQLASGLGYIDGVPYYIPRKLETRILFYRKSMVADAVSKFGKYEKQINKDLKKQNNFGLPAGYVLEKDPNQWDWYDLYVIGFIWANEQYNGAKMPRIAHRGARYEGTALDLVDKALQLGATHKDVLSMGDSTAETLLWETIFIRNGLYNQGMWQDPWRGANLYNGIKDGKIFLTYLQQIDCFNVHGWPDDPGMPAYLPDVNDMGLAAIPKAVSFELTKNGKPVFDGTRAISTGGWWWGIPTTSPNAKLAYEFARFITTKANQALECSKFGMIPVRKDILLNLPEVFPQGWVGDIFKTSVEQVTTNALTTVPLVKEYSQVSQNLIDAWYALCVEYDQKKSGTMTLSLMKEKLQKDFIPKQKQILGADFPNPVKQIPKTDSLNSVKQTSKTDSLNPEKQGMKTDSLNPEKQIDKTDPSVPEKQIDKTDSIVHEKSDK